MKKYYLIAVQFDSRLQSRYVATEADIDNGGFVDATPENFGFQTREEAEKVKSELVDYAFNKACQDDDDYERYHTRADIESMFSIEESHIADDGHWD